MTRKTRKRKKPKGWRNEPVRHGLAGQGVSTVINDKWRFNVNDYVARGRSELITEEELKNWQPQEKHINAVEDVLAWEGVVETIEPIVKGYKRKILEEHDFQVSDEFADELNFRTIESPEETYLMSDEDYEEYQKLIEKAEDKYGFGDLPDDYDPLLIAKSGLRKSKHRLGKEMGDVVGIDYDDIIHPKHKERLVDTSIRYLINEVDSEDVEERGDEFLENIYQGKTKVGV